MTILYSSHPEILKLWESALLPEKTYIYQHEKTLLAALDVLHVNTILILEERRYDEAEMEGFLALLHDKYTFVKTIVLSLKPNYAQGSVLLKNGVKAYGNTYIAPLYLREAIKTVTDGNIWLYPEFIQTMIQTFSSQKIPLHVNQDLLNQLSPKEREVALLIKEGLSNKEIALRAGTTERTIKAHLSSIYAKLGIKDRLTLALLL